MKDDYHGHCEYAGWTGRTLSSTAALNAWKRRCSRLLLGLVVLLMPIILMFLEP